MALYLDEVWLKDPSPERMKEFVGSSARPQKTRPRSAPRKRSALPAARGSQMKTQGHLSGGYS